MTGSCGRIIRSFSPSSAAPSRPARFAACCAIRSASCGSMRSAGANRRAAPNRWCSTRSAIGDLVHMVLDRALRDLESRRRARLRRRGDRSKRRWPGPRKLVAADWESERPVPPAVIWRRTLDDARVMAGRALAYGDDVLPGARSYGEVPFGGSEPKSDAETPWDAERAGHDSRHRLQHRRLYRPARHLGRRQARARPRLQDRPPATRRHPAERRSRASALPLCLRGEGARSATTSPSAPRCSIPREPVDLQLDDPEAVLAEITGYLRAARISLAGGAALPGPDTGGDYDDLAFALPANASATYCKRKLPAATERLGEVAQVWEAE